MKRPHQQDDATRRCFPIQNEGSLDLGIAALLDHTHLGGEEALPLAMIPRHERVHSSARPGFSAGAPTDTIDLRDQSAFAAYRSSSPSAVSMEHAMQMAAHLAMRSSADEASYGPPTRSTSTPQSIPGMNVGQHHHQVGSPRSGVYADYLGVGPPTIVRDASGQEFLVQPVRASAEYVRPSLEGEILMEPASSNRRDSGMSPISRDRLSQRGVGVKYKTTETTAEWLIHEETTTSAYSYSKSPQQRGAPEQSSSYSGSIDVARLYVDGLRQSGQVLTVRMSLPIELEQGRALPNSEKHRGRDMTALLGADVEFEINSGSNSPPGADYKPKSRSSGDNCAAGMPYMAPSDGASTSMFSPFGAVEGCLAPFSPEPSLIPRELRPSFHATLSNTSVVNTEEQGCGHRSGSSAEGIARSGSHINPGDTALVEDNDAFSISENELRFGPRIGIGSFGEVFRGQWRETDVAIKLILDQDVDENVVEGFIKEVALMKRLRHPNIVQFMGACTKPPNLCIVTEYVTRGSLFKLLHRSKSFESLDLRRRLRMTLDVARGMHYLHTCRPPIIHRDLKSPNLLVDKNFTVKVCDFGLSRVRDATVLSAKSCAGTPEWTAPEVLQGSPCNEASDIYSFGVILWELLTGQEPWCDKSTIQVVGAVGFSGQRLAIPGRCSASLAALLNACFDLPEKRPSFGDIILTIKQELHSV